MQRVIATVGLGLIVLLVTCRIVLNPTLAKAQQRSEDSMSPPAQVLALRLQAMLDAAVRDGLPGVSLLLKGEGFEFQAAAGVADLMSREPLTPDHLMYVASVGKMFTAAVALQLCEENKLALDAPITTWLPGELTRRLPSSDKISLRHLLSHTSGVFDYMNDDDTWRTDFSKDPRREWSHDDVIAYLYDKPLLFEPGTDYHYSNSNYVLVGRIVEQATGQAWHQQVRQRILAPLALGRTFNGAETIRGHRRARGYINRNGQIIDTFPWYSHYGLADSGVHTTPAELAAFVRALFATEAILGERMRTLMIDAAPQGKMDDDYGMGIYVQYNPWGAGLRWYTHDGIDPGYQADIMYLPDYDFTVVIAANASLGLANAIYEKLIAAVIEVAVDGVRGHTLGHHRSSRRTRQWR